MWYEIAKTIIAPYHEEVNKLCIKCKKPIKTGKNSIVLINNKYYTFHKNCYAKYRPTSNPKFKTRVIRTATIDPTNPNVAIVKFTYDENIVPLVRRLTSTKVRPIFIKNDPKHGSHWRLSIDEEDIEQTVKGLKELSFDIDPEILKRTTGQKSLLESNVYKEAKSKGLYEYQAQDAAWLAEQRYALLAHDMGLGKTAIALRALPKDRGAIVICPKLVITNWQEEIKLWAPEFTAIPVYKKEDFVFPKTGEIVIINYESIPDRFLPGKKLDNKYYDWTRINSTDIENLSRISLIVDEAHFIKNYKTQRTGKVGAMAHNAASSWLLTGTPLANKPLDLWGVLEAGNMSKKVFGSFSNFIALMNGRKTRYGYEFGTPRKEVAGLLQRVMIRRRKEDVLELLPKKRYIDKLIDIRNIKLIKEMNDLFEEIFKKTSGSLAEFADRLPSFEQFSRIRKELADEKFKYAIQIIEEYEAIGEPLVVFCAHVGPIIELSKRPGWEVIHGQISAVKRGEIVKKFQNNELNGIALTIGAGGIGINLTASRTILFIDMDWKPSGNIQAEDRICRIGQKSENITIIRLIANHALDKHICKLLSIKQKWIEATIEKAATTALLESQGGENECEEIIRQRTMDDLSNTMPKTIIDQMATSDTSGQLAKGEQGKLDIEEESIKELISRRSKEREKAKKVYGGNLELTEERKNLILQAVFYLKSLCDGAIRLDNAGFNKYDANKIRELFLRIRSVNELTDGNYRFLQRLLLKYRDTQLGKEYYSIWNPTEDEKKIKEFPEAYGTDDDEISDPNEDDIKDEDPNGSI